MKKLLTAALLILSSCVASDDATTSTTQASTSSGPSICDPNDSECGQGGGPWEPDPTPDPGTESTPPREISYPAVDNWVTTHGYSLTNVPKTCSCFDCSGRICDTIWITVMGDEMCVMRCSVRLRTYSDGRPPETETNCEAQ